MAKRTEEDEGVTPSIDPMEVLARLTVALEAVGAAQKVAPDVQMAVIMDRLSTALERVSESQLKGSELIASETRRAHRPSNEVIPGISVFNRRGVLLPPGTAGPIKPHLKCIMLIPWLIEWESCTREEVELLNLLESGEYMLRRIDNSKVKVTIKIEMNVDGKRPSRLLMTHDTAFNNDNSRMIPPLSDLLRQILRQHEKPIVAAAAAILTDEEEEALIEAGELLVSR